MASDTTAAERAAARRDSLALQDRLRAQRDEKAAAKRANPPSPDTLTARQRLVYDVVAGHLRGIVPAADAYERAGWLQRAASDASDHRISVNEAGRIVRQLIDKGLVVTWYTAQGYVLALPGTPKPDGAR